MQPEKKITKLILQPKHLKKVKKMEITKRDMIETELVGYLINKVNQMSLTETLEIADRIIEKQPFTIALLIEIGNEVSKRQLEDVRKILYIIFLFFEEKTNIDKIQITPSEFEKHQNLNIKFMTYFTGDLTLENQQESSMRYISNLTYKSLFTGVLFMIENQESLNKIDTETRGSLILTIKSFIDCLEANLLEKSRDKAKG